MRSTWPAACALIALACAETPAPAGRLTRLEVPKTPEDARQAGCDLVGPNDGAGIFALTASIAPGTSILIQAVGLSSEPAPIQLLLGLGDVDADAEPTFDHLMFDQPTAIDEGDRYLDLRVDALTLWPLLLGEGEPSRPNIVMGRFVVDLYAEEEGLYASGAILSGYWIDATVPDLDARVEGSAVSGCAGAGCNGTAVCVRADIDPLAPGSP